MTLLGCGNKQNSVSLEVSNGFIVSAAGFTGGLVVSGKNTVGERFVKTVFGGTSLKAALPDGTWELNVVGWDGGALPTVDQPPFSGTPYCGKSIINLSSSDITATVAVNNAKCQTSDFSGGTYVDVNSSINPLKIVTCGSLYSHENGITKITPENQATIPSKFCDYSNHPLDLKSHSKSIKLIPLNKNIGTDFQPLLEVNPYCVTGTNGIFDINQEIPVKGLPIQIRFYKDAACSELEVISSTTFPDGLEAGLPQKFDSLFAYKDSDSSTPVVSNRLIISDNQFNKGWSAFYEFMPDVRCSTDFCGELPASAIFDYFAEIDYRYTPNDEPFKIEIPSSSDICKTLSHSATSKIDLTTDTCSFDSINKKIKLELFPQVDSSACGTMISNICRSPESTFDFTIGGVTRNIYFQGQKDFYPGFWPVQFSYFFQPVPLVTKANSCDSLGVVTDTYGGLQPDSACQMLGEIKAPTPLVKSSYDNINKTYRVGSDPNSAYGSISFYKSPYNTKLAMLPPTPQQQKEVIRIISDSIGSSETKETFKYFGYETHIQDDDPNARKYGTLRHIREIFSPKGPSMLFDHTVSCDNLVGSNSLTLTQTKDGQLVTYEVIVENITKTHPTWSSDTLLKRPLSMCVASSPNASSTACESSNSGKFEKKMIIKKNGTPETIVLFDCSQKAGRYESLENEKNAGKYRRDKEITFWNTQDNLNKRFEQYSISMEATTSSFGASTVSRRYSFQKVHKLADNEIHGRVMEYSSNQNSLDTVTYQNLSNLRFKLVDSSGFKLSYGHYDFHEDMTKDFFSISSQYQTIMTDEITDTHFCSSYNFPIATFNTNCNLPTYYFDEGEAPILGPPKMNYQVVKPVTLTNTIAPGYKPLTGW